MKKVYMWKLRAASNDIKCVLHLASHQRQELWEVDGAVAISINFVDHILKLRFSGVLAQRTLLSELIPEKKFKLFLPVHIQ